MPTPNKPKEFYHGLAKTHGAISSVDPNEFLPDYSQAPAFLKQGIDMGKVKQVITKPVTQQEMSSTAEVSDNDPYTIKVLADDLYGPPIQHHELTHVYQFTRNKDVGPISTNPTLHGRYNFDYGGIKGLQDAHNAHKTITDFNYEQQAEMVKDYKWKHDQYLKKAAAGTITPADKRAMYELQQAYHPFIQQLSSIPGQDVDIKRNPLYELLGLQKPVDIRNNPAPPGLPSYDTPGLGVLPADPLMGGRSQSTVPKKALSLAEIKAKGDELHKGFVKSGYAQPSKDSPLPAQPKGGEQTLQQVLKEYPGLAKNFNSQNTLVVFANPERSKRGLKERGGLEFWSSNDAGTTDFPSPAPGKNVLEIYDYHLKNNPSALKQAVYGDLMHGMSRDPYWSNLRTQFMQNFTPQEQQRQQQHKTWWDDVNGSKGPHGNATYDAYLRGWIANEGDGRKGQVEQGGTMYSPKQIQILQAMQEYLKTGKTGGNK